MFGLMNWSAHANQQRDYLLLFDGPPEVQQALHEKVRAQKCESQTGRLHSENRWMGSFITCNRLNVKTIYLDFLFAWEQAVRWILQSGPAFGVH